MPSGSKVTLRAGNQGIIFFESSFEEVNLDISEKKKKLFDSMVLPILLYGAETWGFHPSRDSERVYLKFLK